MISRALALVLLIAAACGGGSSRHDETLIEHGSWTTCESGSSCQDVYDITVPASAHLEIAVSDLTGGSLVDLALYAPGMALDGTNLLTATTLPLITYDCEGGCSSGLAAPASVDTSVAGTYRLAVIRDWSKSCGLDGTYTLTVTGPDIELVSQSVEDGLALSGVCDGTP